MVPAQTPLRNTAAAPKTRLGCFYVPHGATMYKWTPAAAGRDFAHVGDPHSSREVSRQAHRRQQPLAQERHRRRRRRRACAIGCHLPERRAPAEERRPRRRDDRSDRGAAHRTGHAAAVDRARHRRRQPELRRRIWLRLLQHDLLADADGSAADGEQPAGRVREAVRRRRHGGAAAAAQARGSQHSRFDSPADAGAQKRAAGVRPRAGRRLSRRHPRDRTAHQDLLERGETQSSCRTLPSARRRRSTSTSS